MKILRLGNSQDFVGVDPAFSRESLLCSGLEAELGEPVEMVTKRAWPTERLPLLLRGWLEEEEPDVVFLQVPSYWFMYESVPLKLQRRLGRLGVAVGKRGQALADVSWLAHNRVFRTGRKLLTRVIGGEANFTAEEVIERMTAVVREVVRHEGVVLHVQGPPSDAHYGHSRRAMARLEQSRQQVTQKLAELCAAYRVSFRGYPVPTWQTGEGPKSGGDGVHYGAEGNAVWAAPRVADIAAAVREARGTGAGEARQR